MTDATRATTKPQPAATKAPKRDMRHIFACPDATGAHWQVYRRDFGGGWGSPEPRGGIREIVECDLRDALQFSIDVTAYGRHVPLEALDPDLPLRSGAVCYLPEGLPGLDRWASVDVDPLGGPSYREPFGRRPDGGIAKALEALWIPPAQAWEFRTPNPLGLPGLMVRHHVTLQDYLPAEWAAMQARYNQPSHVVPGAYTAAEAAKWRHKGAPRGAATSVTLKPLCNTLPSHKRDFEHD